LATRHFKKCVPTSAACYAHLGRLDAAREVIDRLRVLTPEVRPPHLPFRHPEHQELFLSGLRMAAGEAP